MKYPSPSRSLALDALRGVAVLWMTAFHFAFDLNQFGFIHQDFHTTPLWTVQRTCILGLFLVCAGAGQAMALHQRQDWRAFWWRWCQIAGCAVLVSAGSYLMFPQSWIYFGVLHGMAVMLVLCRLSASWGRGLWLAGALAMVAGYVAPQVHSLVPGLAVLNDPALNWLGLVSRKPMTEDYVPLLPWLGVMWWGMAGARMALVRGWLGSVGTSPAPGVPTLVLVGQWSLTWYMLHQPLLIGLVLWAKAG